MNYPVVPTGEFMGIVKAFSRLGRQSGSTVLSEKAGKL
jgi:hypothetical protein